MRATLQLAQKMGSGLGRGEVLLRPLPPNQKNKPMTTLIYWFRNDLRLADNPALLQACSDATHVVPVYCRLPTTPQLPRWGFERMGVQRQRFLTDTLRDLATQLQARGSQLIECMGHPHEVLPALAKSVQAAGVVCEDIAAPEEEAQVAALRSAGLAVNTVWQSSLLDLDDLPFDAGACPEVFTAFRQSVERAKVLPATPLKAPAMLPPLPPLHEGLLADIGRQALERAQPAALPDARSSFPHHTPAFAGGEAAAAAHIQRYFSTPQVSSYKATRNGLTGTDYSSKFSPWLATGALSARTAYAGLKRFENTHGTDDGTYWLWFELLWRDYFRLIQLKHGAYMYRARGLRDDAPPPAHNPRGFARWCAGTTGEPLVDAGMRELSATGYLSNRLRQVVASYLIYDLNADWRAGAAWFESQLLDYDAYSNQGNWLYIAGRGTDPRGGRRFNVKKQAQDHDPDKSYQRLWQRV